MTEQHKQHVLAKKAEHRPFDFDQYYHQIESDTFRSIILPVDPPTASAMVSYYQQRYNGRSGGLSRTGVKNLETLHSSIFEAIKNDFCGSPVFCRMTNRSPKDGEPAGHMDDLRQYYREELEALTAAAGAAGGGDVRDDEEDQVNLKMVAASAAQLRSLRCTCADDVMNLLLSSERVFVDTLLALECHRAKGNDIYDSDDGWSTFLILREWNDGVGRGDWEFRLFVYKGRLNAISQYNHYCIFHSLLKIDQNYLVEEIVKYWKAVREIISQIYSSYIMDIVKLTDGTWKIIELNPFAPTTGAALFDWNADRDILMMTNNNESSKQQELRIRRKFCKGLEEYLEIVMLPAMLPLTAEGHPCYSGPWENFLKVEEEENDESNNLVTAKTKQLSCIVL